jgi:hypothetical protein
LVKKAAVWLVLAYAVATTIFIVWATNQWLQPSPTRCGERPPL